MTDPTTIDAARRRQAIGWPLRVALLVAALAVVHGLATRYWPRDFDAAVEELLDGDADRRERRAFLEQVRDQGLEVAKQRRRAGPAVLAASSALLLGDEAGYRRILAGMAQDGLPSPFVPGGPARAPVEAGFPGDGGDDVDRLGLGVARVRNLLLGQAAENAGRPDEARTLFQQSRRSAWLAGDGLCERLAREGLDRLQ